MSYYNNPPQNQYGGGGAGHYDQQGQGHYPQQGHSPQPQQGYYSPEVCFLNTRRVAASQQTLTSRIRTETIHPY